MHQNALADAQRRIASGRWEEMRAGADCAGLRETIVLQMQLIWTRLGARGSGFVVQYT